MKTTLHCAAVLFLLGILNLQKYGEPASKRDGDAIYHAFFAVAGQELIRDGHHWVNAENFHLAFDGPKLLDYGSLVTQRIINEYGIALHSGFDIEYGRAQTERYRRPKNTPASSL